MLIIIGVVVAILLLGALAWYELFVAHPIHNL